jgi:hypothetical protein
MYLSEATMTCTQLSSESAANYELRFDSLFVEGRGMSFPCDARGQVDLDTLSDRARCNYLYARAVVGREFRTPAVRLSDLH